MRDCVRQLDYLGATLIVQVENALSGRLALKLPEEIEAHINSTYTGQKETLYPAISNEVKHYKDVAIIIC